MKIEIGLNPNCSEAVFRFYTDEPKVAHRILQAFADGVSTCQRRSMDAGREEWKGGRMDDKEPPAETIASKRWSPNRTRRSWSA